MRDSIDRIVDMRWLFPTAEAATAYHRATIAQRAEGLPKLPHAPAVGADCLVVGTDLGRLEQRLTGKYEPHFACIYLFTVDRMVAKLFVSGTVEHPTVSLACATASHIPARIQAALARLPGGAGTVAATPAPGETSGSPRRPWWRRWGR